MKMRGGLIHSDWKITEHNEETGKIKRECFALVWGTVTNDTAPMFYNSKKGKKARCCFRIRLERKKFVRCTIYQENPFYWNAIRLKRNEVAGVCGRLIAYTYTNADGEEKIGIDCFPMFMFSQKPGEPTPEEIDLAADMMYGDDDEDAPDPDPDDAFDLGF